MVHFLEKELGIETVCFSDEMVISDKELDIDNYFMNEYTEERIDLRKAKKEKELKFEAEKKDNEITDKAIDFIKNFYNLNVCLASLAGQSDVVKSYYML